MPADNPQKTEAESNDEVEEEELTPSDLDESTHSEMRLLYRESVDTVLFAKAQQWKTVGATLLLYLVFLVVARFISNDPFLIKGLGAIVLVATPPALVILLFYQIWQNIERHKLDDIASLFSSQFRNISAIKSLSEANIIRYLLLVFMMTLVILSGTVTFFTLLELQT